ncbi:MAG: hypothetical protein Q8930_02460 [Bacillota bacterium]|nr:hypothetical protein [Bacillota bacterium]
MKKNMRTIILKLYNPSKRKSEIIDKAMYNYTRAFQFLLNRANSEIEAIRMNYTDGNGGYSPQSVARWIGKDLDKELNSYSVEPFKDSLKLDFASVLTEYLNVKAKGRIMNYPVAYISSEEEEKKYEAIMEQAYKENNLSRNVEKKMENLFSKAEKLRPLFFCRYDTGRNYCILHDTEKNRYYAKIYLMNSKSEERERPSGKYKGKLFYIDSNSSPFYEKGGKRTFLIFPLSFGRWQESFLKNAIEDPKSIKTARLIKRNQEYYLAVNIIRKSPEEIKTVNYMGISRGIDNALSYSIVDQRGKVISSGPIKGDDLYKIARSIAGIAVKDSSLVIMEKLVVRGDNLNWKDNDGNSYMPGIERAKYNALAGILKYKLTDFGLPGPVRVSGLNIFYSCPYCGINSRLNRFSSHLFMCTSCGATMNIEMAGSLNLAKRLIKYGDDPVRFKAENTTEGVRFVNGDLEFEYYPSNPYDCAEEFRKRVDEFIRNFYENINEEKRKRNYIKKLSLIKKLESKGRIEVTTETRK